MFGSVKNALLHGFGFGAGSEVGHTAMRSLFGGGGR